VDTIKLDDDTDESNGEPRYYLNKIYLVIQIFYFSSIGTLKSFIGN